MTEALRPTATRALALFGALATLVALLAFAAQAQAARDPIASGNTDLHMKGGFMRKLSNLGINVTGFNGGSASGNKIGTAVSGGKLDPTNVEGFVEGTQGYQLNRGGRSASVTNLNVNTVRGAVFASVAGAHMQFATFPKPSSAREGFGSNFKAGQLTLTAKAAQRISNTLKLSGSQAIPSRVMSNLFVSAQPGTVTVLPQGAATLNANPTTLAKFGAKGVELPKGITPIAPATQPKATVLSFPIAGGNLTPTASSGTVSTTGGVQIAKQAKPYSPTVTIKNIQVDFAAKTATAEMELLPNPPLPGSVGRSAIVAISFEAKQVIANPTLRTITIENAAATLQAATAQTLNSVFNQPAPEPPPASNFVTGDPLGTFSLTVQAQ
jgi:hypothetical protein